MAFNKDNLHQMSRNYEGPNLFSYTTTDAIADVNTSGYFNDAEERLTKNDVIMCVSSTGGTPAVHWLHVNEAASGTVDVTDGLAVGTTDTD